VGFSVFTGLQ